MSEKYSATYPAEQAGIFFTYIAVKTPEKLQVSDIVRSLFLLDNLSIKREVLPMVKTIIYPKACRRNINRLVNTIGVSVETAYAMMLLTATLMDLHPEDEEVTDMILEDCGISPECA